MVWLRYNAVRHLYTHHLQHTQVPASVCLPFGTFDHVVNHPSNSQTAWTLEKLLKELQEYSTDAGVPPTLAAIRDLVTTFLKVWGV